MQQTDRLFLLDGMALAYRAHFALISRPLINSKGMDTSAVFGFTGALLRLLEKENPERIAVIFDVMGEGGTFRDQMYEDYKAHRPPPPEELLIGLPYIKAIIDAFDIPRLEDPNVEADDIIGTIAKRAASEKIQTIIVSPDKDFRQLLSPYISIMRPSRRGEEFDLTTDLSFIEEYGVEPIKFIDILALLGDTADNVPGVKGIGEKTAPDLIAKYGSVESLLEHAEEIKAKRVREGLINYREEALLSKKLVTILTDLELDFDWHNLVRTLPDEPKLNKLFDELEFRSYRQRVHEQVLQLKGYSVATPGEQGDLFGIPSSNVTEVSPETSFDEAEVSYELLNSTPKLDSFLSKLQSQPSFAFDTETTGLDPLLASLVGCSFSFTNQEAFYLPTPLPDGTSTEVLLENIKSILTDNSIQKIGQNIKYDMLIMRQHGVALAGDLFDTMVAHYLLAPDQPHNLDALARMFINYDKIPTSDLIGKGKNQISMRDVPLQTLKNYACEDADVTWQLSKILSDALEKEGLTEIAKTIEFPLISVLAEMEWNGIRIDVPMLRAYSEELGERLDLLEKQIYETAGESFNIGSPKQIGEIFFGKLGMPIVQKTKTGQPSTNERVMEILATEHELPAMILDWRKLAKLKSTYVDALPALVNPHTNRIHTSFNQTIASTGRLSSSNPNLQNIPIRTGDGREIRKAFVPAEGCVLLAADYAQIELRIIASMSGDEGLKEAFQTGLDIHTAAASRIFKISPEEITRTQRNRAKEVNYGIPYGISANGMSQRMRIPIDEARDLIKAYHQSYPGVTSFNRQLIEHAQEKGYVETLKGRRRYVPEINARNPRARSAAERIAVNMPIQGTQADMIKLAMVNIHQRIQQEGLNSKMILQVHDELLFEVYPEELETMKELVKTEMENALPLDVPVLVEMGIGNNWLDAH